MINLCTVLLEMKNYSTECKQKSLNTANIGEKLNIKLVRSQFKVANLFSIKEPVSMYLMSSVVCWFILLLLNFYLIFEKKGTRELL